MADDASIGAMRTRIAGLVARALVKSIDDSAIRQLAQLEVMDGEIHDDCEVFQPAGLATRPSAGRECIVLFIGGNRSLPAVICLDTSEIRPAVEEGEAALYSEEDGDSEADAHRVHLATGRKVYIRGTAIQLGTDAGAQLLALKSDLTALKTAIANWTPTPGDGGATLKPVIAAWTPAGTTKTKAE